MPFYADPNTVHNPSTGAVAPASWGDNVRDNLDFFYTSKPRCRLYRSSTQSIADATETAVVWNAESWDNDTLHDLVTNPSRVTIQTSHGGVYRVAASVQLQSMTTGFVYLTLWLNGVGSGTLLARSTVGVSATFDPGLHVSCDYSFAAGDYVEAAVYQTNGSARNVQTAGSWMTAEFVGA
jgi:hypothetical protein